MTLEDRHELYKEAHRQALENQPELQSLIDSGQVWLYEGSYGRAASRALESGACVLPPKPYDDHYGNTVPPYIVLKEGTKGTPELTLKYYAKQ